MPWTSKYNAKFTKPLVRQLVGIIRRDIRAALDHVSPLESLPEFVQYHVAKSALLQFPSILIAAHDAAFDIDANGTIHSDRIRLAIAIGCAHQNRDALAERVQDYVRAVDEILRTSAENTQNDFYAADIDLPTPPFAVGSLTPGLGAARLMDLFVESHSLGEVLESSTNGFVMAGTLVVSAELEEQ